MMKVVSIVLVGIALTSCHHGEPTGGYATSPKQNVDLLLPGKGINEVYIDSTKIDLKTDGSAIPMSLNRGSHVATWRFNEQEIDCTFEVEPSDGSLSLLVEPPFVNFSGGVTVASMPKSPHR